MNKLFDAFKESGHELYFVGGYVRDFSKGATSDDVDFATSATPEETIETLKGAGFNVYPIGLKFGTIATEVGGRKIEITTYRCAESYTKGSRKPEVKFGNSLQEDLLRRDFTFNAMAMDQNLNTIDPYNGLRDLEEGIIRTPMDASVTFRDDPLRMLRAARFEARGYGDVDGPTFCAMRDNQTEVLNLSGERVFEEMSKLLTASCPSKGLTLLSETGILFHLFPYLYNENFELLDYIPPSSNSVVRWAALFAHWPTAWNHAKRSKRVVVDNKTFEDVAQIIDEVVYGKTPTCEVHMRRLVARFEDNLDNFLCVRDIEEAGFAAKTRRLQREMHTKLPSKTGNLLMEELGLKGPKLGVVMRTLTQNLIDGVLNIDSDFVEEARKML